MSIITALVSAVQMGVVFGLSVTCVNTSTRGGLSGFSSIGKLVAYRMLAVLFAITTGVSYRNLKAMVIKVSPGTWTGYVKDVGMLFS